MEKRKENVGQWWGHVVVPHDHIGRWQIGPLTLWVERLECEWRIARESNYDAGSAIVEHKIGPSGDDLLSKKSLSRFGVSGNNESMKLVPALADRDVVSTPQRPFHIPAGEEVTIYVGAPLWVQLLAGNDKAFLEEFALHQPSDTWFGPNTQTGELCYATRSFCRLQLSALQGRPHRSTTAVLIQNQASTPLYLDRFKLPVPFLSLYADPETATLWTNDVVLQRLDSEELAPLEIRNGAPAARPTAIEIAKPRQHVSGNVMVRAFESLFADHLGGA